MSWVDELAEQIRNAVSDALKTHVEPHPAEDKDHHKREVRVCKVKVGPMTAEARDALLGLVNAAPIPGVCGAEELKVTGFHWEGGWTADGPSIMTVEHTSPGWNTFETSPGVYTNLTVLPVGPPCLTADFSAIPDAPAFADAPGG